MHVSFLILNSMYSGQSPYYLMEVSDMLYDLN